MGRKNKFFETQTEIKKKPHAERQVLVTRAQWKAREPKEPLSPGPTPINYVVLTWTDTEICEWPEACMKTIREVQADQMDNQGLPDIRYNFLVGTDMVMYEGRGWDVAGPTYPESIKGADQINGKSIEIAFIDKNMNHPSIDLSETVLKFLAVQLEHKRLAKPVEFKGILNNRFVRFSKIFEGEKIGTFMFDEDEKAERAELLRQSDEWIKEREAIIAERREFVMRESTALLAERREMIKSKTPEAIKTEFGFTEDVDVTQLNYDKLKEALSGNKAT